jgi:hypothetical protein
MADPNLEYDPITGWLSETVFVKNPVSEAQTRSLMQRLFTQIQTYLNTTYTAWINATFATITSLNAAVLSGIADDSLTNAKLATDVKIGSNATLTTTHKTTVVGAVNEINAKVPTGTIVGTSDTQVLTNKTLTSPVINTGVSGTAIDTDVTLAANVDTKLATQKATKAYADTKIAKSVITASGDIVIGTGANTPSVLPKATDGNVLEQVAGLPAWVSKTGAKGYATLSQAIATTYAWTINMGYASKQVILSVRSNNGSASPFGLETYIVNGAGSKIMDYHELSATCPDTIGESTSGYIDFGSGTNTAKISSIAISGNNLVINFVTVSAGTTIVAEVSYSAI